MNISIDISTDFSKFLGYSFIRSRRNGGNTVFRTTDSTGDRDFIYIPGSTFYIDPTNSNSGRNGSIENPWNSWSEISIASGRQYLFKRGTTLTTTGNFGILNTYSSLVFGAYGTGDRPKLVSTTVQTNTKILDFGGDNTNILISGLDISADSLLPTTNLNFAGSNTGIIVEDCYLHGCQFGMRVRSNATDGYNNDVTINNVVIENTSDDGLYMYKCNNVYMNHVYIHGVNKAWAPGVPQTTAAGDGTQFIYIYGFLLNDLKIDRSDSGNKFCWIMNSTGNGAITNSHFISPLYTTEGGGIIYLDHGANVTFYNNTFEGNSADPATSLDCIYHNNAGGTTFAKNNTFKNLPRGIVHLNGAMNISDNTFVNCPIQTTGSVITLSGVQNPRPNVSFTPFFITNTKTTTTAQAKISYDNSSSTTGSATLFYSATDGIYDIQATRIGTRQSINIGTETFNLSGLTVGTTYYFQLNLTNSTGTRSSNFSIIM